MLRALIVEFGKLRHASLLWWSVAAVFAAPTLSNVFADANKAHLSWPDFLKLGSMTMGTWYGVLLFGLITAFVFGREYTEGVAPNMLTVPIRREHFVLAKFVVIAVWILALALFSVAAQAAWATALGLQGFAWSSVWAHLGNVLRVAMLIFLTLPLVALLAVISRGVFAPMIFSAFAFTLGMIGGPAGWADWLPWAMPTAIAGTFLGPVAASHIPTLTALSWAIDISVFAIGMAALLWWVDRADSHA